uniref:Uncharacterized protein n=2 Tax=Noccaea caerulescens TaxID=107243 RepID=A0A1J3EC82_NOCCA
MLVKMVLDSGFAENMSKFSHFPSGEVGVNRKDLESDRDVMEMLSLGNELESVNLYCVRADDPYLDDVLTGEEEEEEEDDNDGDLPNFYRDDYVESADSDDDSEKIEFFVGQEFVSKEKISN